ncbi:MAG: hypothetical protein M4D80_27040 [Myxococcota bacterium]|nr:hypothetical protein [Myxococcota bacterium]
MRLLAVTILLAACGGSTRPAVIPKLSELPGDSQRRDAILDSAHHQPTPEQHKKLTPKERKVETVAATAAAIIGSMMSDSKNVTLGIGTAIEENHLVDDTQERRETKATNEHERQHVRYGSKDLRDGGSVDVPWVRLK